METNAMNDKCIPQETVLENVRLAQAYVPFQILCTTFTPAAGLTKGTIFPPLWDNYTKSVKGPRVFEDDE
ncbi:MAG: hypothetical protein CVU91_05740 [Firmicutes bacterium HGW-Firmicutes-16]|nr:MAG: hypothetical protein CVU91_05860 [Firmicutes bacterium HGW-Firmicutes-16]PKM73427.1 MAG: hypothetical protein CVU91_05740 [Firmicutes bacterium HGW-Firmicutes-16]